MGAVQIVQNLNGPYMSARGQPTKTLALLLLKYAFITVGLLLVRTGSLNNLIMLYVLLQVIVAPFSFGVLAQELGLAFKALAQVLVPGAIGCGLSFCAVVLARPHVASVLHHDLLSGIALGALFAACLVAYDFVFARSQVVTILQFLAKRLGQGTRVAT
jgi:hypothetical protein